jgi:hypothetical protein
MSAKQRRYFLRSGLFTVGIDAPPAPRKAKLIPPAVVKGAAAVAAAAR